MNTLTEIWLPIARTNGAAMVSNLGQIKKVKSGKILKPFLKANGYYAIAVSGQTFLVSRAVAIAFIPNPEGKPQVNHLDCNPANNAASNLEWVTAAENIAHAEKFHGRRFGARINQKLDEAQVIAARALVRAGTDYKAVARKFSASPSSIYSAVYGYTWKQLNSISKPVTK